MVDKRAGMRRGGELLDVKSSSKRDHGNAPCMERLQMQCPVVSARRYNCCFLYELEFKLYACSYLVIEVFPEVHSENLKCHN